MVVVGVATFRPRPRRRSLCLPASLCSPRRVARARAFLRALAPVRLKKCFAYPKQQEVKKEFFFCAPHPLRAGERRAAAGETTGAKQRRALFLRCSDGPEPRPGAPRRRRRRVRRLPLSLPLCTTNPRALIPFGTARASARKGTAQFCSPPSGLASKPRSAPLPLYRQRRYPAPAASTQPSSCRGSSVWRARTSPSLRRCR